MVGLEIKDSGLLGLILGGCFCPLLSMGYLTDISLGSPTSNGNHHFFKNSEQSYTIHAPGALHIRFLKVMTFLSPAHSPGTFLLKM